MLHIIDHINDDQKNKRLRMFNHNDHPQAKNVRQT